MQTCKSFNIGADQTPFIRQSKKSNEYRFVKDKKLKAMQDWTRKQKRQINADLKRLRFLEEVMEDITPERIKEMEELEKKLEQVGLFAPSRLIPNLLEFVDTTGSAKNDKFMQHLIQEYY